VQIPPRWRSFVELPRVFGGPVVRARLRAVPEDFIVDEELAFGPEGEGEHCLLRVRKVGVNTDWVARRLANIAGVPGKAVGYAGLKDRHAVTTQWFSVHLGNRPEPSWQVLADDGVEVLEQHRHRRKLRRGLLAANNFRLRLRDVEGDLDALEERVACIASDGVPNYFGSQRFGRDENNLRQADALFRAGRCGTAAQLARRISRHVRGLWLSAARSQLFNEVLALRVEAGTWRSGLPGERLQLRGSHSHFLAETLDAEILARIDSGDVQPTGPLFGAGPLPTTEAVAAIEHRIGADFAHWVEGLAAAGMDQERRPLRLDPEGIAIERPEPDQVVLSFSLPAGSYATSLLRELADWSE
jgi:tRNA pseudouridine13 synthase